MTEVTLSRRSDLDRSIVVATFIVLTAVTFAILPALGIERVGTAVSAELKLQAAPPTPAPRKEAPRRPSTEGIPVAAAFGTGP